MSRDNIILRLRARKEMAEDLLKYAEAQSGEHAMDRVLRYLDTEISRSSQLLAWSEISNEK